MQNNHDKPRQYSNLANHIADNFFCSRNYQLGIRKYYLSIESLMLTLRHWGPRNAERTAGRTIMSCCPLDP